MASHLRSWCSWCGSWNSNATSQPKCGYKQFEKCLGNVVTKIQSTKRTRLSLSIYLLDRRNVQRKRPSGLVFATLVTLSYAPNSNQSRFQRVAMFRCTSEATAELITTGWQQVKWHTRNSSQMCGVSACGPSITYVYTCQISTEKRATMILSPARPNTKTTRKCWPKPTLACIDTATVHWVLQLWVASWCTMQRNWHNSLGWIRCLLRSTLKIKSMQRWMAFVPRLAKPIVWDHWFRNQRCPCFGVRMQASSNSLPWNMKLNWSTRSWNHCDLSFLGRSVSEALVRGKQLTCQRSSSQQFHAGGSKKAPGDQVCQRSRVSSADLMVKIRWKSKLQCFSSYHANWKVCANSSARSCRKFQCRLSATSLRRSALWPLCFAPHLPQMLSTTTFAAQWWHSLATSWRNFLFSGANHGSIAYLLVVGVIAGTLPIFTSPTRTWWFSRGQDSASWFPRMDLTLFSSSLPARSRHQWTFVWSSVRQLPPLRLTDRSL